jgi:hypothetical protein
MRLPDEVFATLRAVCARYPYATVQDRAHLGAILNETAWAHRDEGWGLSRKEGGTNVPSPVGLIAEDVLHHRPTNLHWDVLQAAGVGYPLQPIQTDAIGPMRDPARPWVAPVRPEVTVVPTSPRPTSPSVPPPDALGTLRAQLDTLIEQQRVLLHILAGSATRADVEALGDRVQGWLWAAGHPDPSIVEHIDDAKRIAAGVPRDARFLGQR